MIKLYENRGTIKKEQNIDPAEPSTFRKTGKYDSFFRDSNLISVKASPIWGGKAIESNLDSKKDII